MKVLGAVLVGGICILCYWIGQERGEVRLLHRMEHSWRRWSAPGPSLQSKSRA